MERWRERFSARLRHLKDRDGLTQQALADQLGVAQSTIAGWLHGRREPESLRQFEALAYALDVHPAWLLYGVEIDTKTANLVVAIHQLPPARRQLVQDMIDQFAP